MSTILDRPAAVARPEALRTTTARVIRSEWIKARTLRSTWVWAAAILVVIVGFGLVAAMTASGDVGPAGGGAAASSDPTSTVLVGANFAILLIAVVGAITGAREYATGMIRTSLGVVPRRLPVLWGKLAGFLAIYVPVVLVGVVVAFTAGTAVLSGSGATTASWSDDGVLRAVLGTGLEVVGIGMLSLAFGFLLRSTAAAIGVSIGAVMFLPTLAAALLPDSWDAVLKFLPAQAASSFAGVAPDATSLGLVAGLVVFLAWVVAAVAGAAFVLRARDV